MLIGWNHFKRADIRGCATFRVANGGCGDVHKDYSFYTEPSFLKMESNTIHRADSYLRDEKAAGLHNITEINNSAQLTEVVQNAKEATDAEHNMSLWQGLKTYPKAAGWSIAVSSAIIMEVCSIT